MERRGRRIFPAREEPAEAHDPTQRDVPLEPLSAATDGSSSTDSGDELAARRSEIARLEEIALHEVEAQRLKSADLARREHALVDRERNIEAQAAEVKRQKQVQRRELERLSGLTVTQAKQMLIADVEHEARHRTGRALIQIEEEAKRDADRRARNILAIATQRLAAAHASETTTRLIELPNEEMKGRIIGREGRNIRALEAVTGVDVIIDETPNAVVVSSFDGVRREKARMAIERLIGDGRINPSTIEEAYATAERLVEEQVVEEGGRAELAAGLHGLAPELLMVLGRLRFRTSYGQNVLDHLVECANLAGLLANELGASTETAKRAAFLHDIGKAVSHEVEGSHAAVGATMARRHGESDAVVHAVEAHHNGVEPRTVEAVIVQTVDALSGARPGARGEALEQYVARLRDLEEIAGRHPGVEKVLAMRAGREVRVMVDPGAVDDEEAAVVAEKVAKAVEKELSFPGRIKIVVIRESRISAWAD